MRCMSRLFVIQVYYVLGEIIVHENFTAEKLHTDVSYRAKHSMYCIHSHTLTFSFQLEHQPEQLQPPNQPRVCTCI